MSGDSPSHLGGVSTSPFRNTDQPISVSPTHGESLQSLRSGGNVSTPTHSTFGAAATGSAPAFGTPPSPTRPVLPLYANNSSSTHSHHNISPQAAAVNANFTNLDSDPTGIVSGVRDLHMGSPTRGSTAPNSPTRSSPLRESVPVGNNNNPFIGQVGNETSYLYAGVSPQQQQQPQQALAVNNNPIKEMSMEDYEKLNDPKVKRLVDVAQLYFFDYYFDLLTYVHARQQRLLRAKASLAQIPDPAERNRQLASYLGRERVQLRKRRVKLKYGDFKILTQVGQGGYGQVYLARKSDTKEICALKVLNKKLLQKLDEVRHILTERDILTAAKSPWLVKLLYAFQDSMNVYLAMEFVPGGDYRTLLNNTGILNPRHTRFYISEMFCALDALHKLGYIHRDLKPENFLIDSTGHIKLTDFGLASGAISKERVESMRIKLDALKDMEIPYRSVSERQRMYRSLRASDITYAHSVVGSPDYMALEVLQGRKYDYTIDYWSLGCMLFETLAGYPPFAGSTPDETYANLQQWKRSLHRPQYEDGRFVFSDRTWDLIQRLITSPRYRFQSFDEIKVHPYFAEVHWDTLRQSTPPFIPQLDDETDAGYFDDFSNETDMAKYKEVLEKRSQVESLSDRGVPLPSRAFIGFTFKHQKLHGTGATAGGTGTGGFDDGFRQQSQQRSFRSRRNVDSPFDTIF